MRGCFIKILILIYHKTKIYLKILLCKAVKLNLNNRSALPPRLLSQSFGRGAYLGNGSGNPPASLPSVGEESEAYAQKVGLSGARPVDNPWLKPGETGSKTL